TQKTWTYTLQSVNCSSKNEEMAYAEMRIDRLGRGEFGLSGILDLKVDVSEDMEVEVFSYRSTDQGANYKIQPYSLPRQSFYQAMNSFYKDMIMDSAANCSNLPQFDDKITDMTAQKFVFDKCQVSTEKFPQHMPDGWYKLTFTTYGIMELYAEIIVSVDKIAI
ncbi:hypothetical protein KR018_006049, partial [Drosophila ironensis]